MGSKRFGVFEDKVLTPTKIRIGTHGVDMDLGVTVISTARCGGLTTLKKGLAMGKITASGKYKEYNNASSDGSEVFAGLLADEIDLTEGSSDGITAVDQPGGVLIVHGIVDESECTGVDSYAKADPVGVMIAWR